MSNGGAKWQFFQFENASGVIYASCKLFHYVAGTTTDKDIWTDEAKTTAAAQPIVGDSRGIVTFYADGDYKFVLKDSADNTLYTWDNVRITSDSATMWEGNHGTAYPTAAAANIWQLFAKHTAGNVLQELGINNGSSFVPLMSIDSNPKYAADTGAADAYLIAPSPAITAYTAGQIFYMKAGNANTGASTINVNSLGIKSIKKNQGTALEANNILANQVIGLIYDGTNFELLNAIPESGTQTLTNKTLTSPVLSGTITGTYTLSAMAYTSTVYAGVSTSTMKLSGLIASDADAIWNSGSGETDLHSFTVPSGAITNSFSGIRAIFFGDNASNANYKTLKLYVEGVEVFQMTSNISDAKWKMELIGIRNGDYLIVNVIGHYGAAAPTATYVYNNTPIGTTISISGAVSIKITGQGTSTADITSYAGTVELLQG